MLSFRSDTIFTLGMKINYSQYRWSWKMLFYISSTRSVVHSCTSVRSYLTTLSSEASDWIGFNLFTRRIPLAAPFSWNHTFMRTLHTSSKIMLVFSWLQPKLMSVYLFALLDLKTCDLFDYSTRSSTYASTNIFTVTI